MRLKVAFLLALTLLTIGASTLVGLNVAMPVLHRVTHYTTMNVDLSAQPCGDPVPGQPDIPH